MTSTLEECIEGADFIGNAAYSRDNGMARAAFLDRLEAHLAGAPLPDWTRRFEELQPLYGWIDGG